MASPILVKSTKGPIKFFWNVDSPVGLNASNLPEDVQLVQFGYSFMAKGNLPGFTRADKAVFAAVKVGAPCTGREDDPLVKAIRTHQRSRGGTQDGKVSKIHVPTGVYQDSTGPHTFMLLSIVNNIFDAMPVDFPRIDRHPACPGALKAAVLRACTL